MKMYEKIENLIRLREAYFENVIESICLWGEALVT